MKFSKRQRGLTMWETCLYIFVFLFIVTIALKLGPLYIDDMNISSAIDSVHENVAGKDIDEVTNIAIKGYLSKNFQVSMIADERLKDVVVERTGSKVLLKVNYDARNSFMGNVDIVVHFKHEVDLAEPYKK
ncbi:MAG TPA: DUF4845 domain-containing protein [Pseudomonadales bacterium]|nr:DUF4845 domain-containing protein [Pseudomonadales bacterium]